MKKTAQIVDHSKWPDNFQEYQKAHNDKLVWLARKAVLDDRKNRGKWGLATSDGKFLSSDDDVDNEEKLKSVIIRAGEAAKRARRASCHELAESILNRLRENKINARRIFVDKDRYNGVAMGHSTVFFQGDDGHWHRAANGIGARKKSRLGDFDSLEDAIDQYIAVEKANKQTTDDERVDAYDTTDLPFTDNMPWPDYKALARTGKRIYHQEKKAGARDFSGLLKLAGPSLRDKANAGVLGAKEELDRRRAETAYRHTNPSYLGSLAQQKARLQTEAQKALARQSPEVQAKFWDDARKYQANAARLRAAAGAFIPGIGLGGAALMTGLGEAGASGIEGRGLNNSLLRGASAGATTYAGGRAINALGRHVVKPVYNATRAYLSKLGPHARFIDRLRSEILFSKARNIPSSRSRNNTFLRRNAISLADEMRTASHGQERLRANLARLGDSVRGHQTPDQVLFQKILTRSPELQTKNSDLVRRLAERLSRDTGYGKARFVFPEYQKPTYSLARDIESGFRTAEKNIGTKLSKLNPVAHTGVGGPISVLDDGRNFDQLIGYLRDNNPDYIFKGSKTPSFMRGSGNYWWSHNPAVSAGYAGDTHGFLAASPISGRTASRAYSRFTPHIATDDPKIISMYTNRGGAPVSRLAGHSDAGNAYDYELVLNPEETKESLLAAKRFLLKKPKAPTKKMPLPIMHGVEPAPSYNPGYTFYEIPEGYVPKTNLPRFPGVNMKTLMYEPDGFIPGRDLYFGLREHLL